MEEDCVDKKWEFIVCERCEGVRQGGVAEEREFKKREKQPRRVLSQ